LRKKLDSYYKNEGKDEKVRLTIPKGHYHIEFIERDLKYHPPIKSSNFKLITSLYLLTFTILILALKFYINKYYYPIMPVTKHPFWAEFVNSKQKTCMVIGDLVLYSEYNSSLKKWRTVLDPDINSKDDFQQFAAKHPERNMEKANITRIHMSTVPNLMKMLPIFHSIRNNLVTEWSTELSWDDLRKHNIIYIGNVRSLQILKNLFNDKTIKVEHPEKIFLSNIEGDTIETYQNMVSKEYSETYSIISKFKGPYKNTILLLIGTEYPSRIVLFDHLSELSFLEEIDRHLMNKYGKKIQFFEMLIKVSGYFRIGFNQEIIYFNDLSD
jgi:hypothetical protein